jgi:phosphoenolpyruvate carboxylase
MGRINKTIDGAFIDLVGTPNELSLYNQFIKQGDEKIISKELTGLTEIYGKLILNHKSTFELLASLEEIIIQMRIRENLDVIKITQVREYLYVRTPFYRKDKKSKDIRVLVDNLEFYPEINGDINKLYDNESFMNKSKIKLMASMDNEIEENIRVLKSTYGM